MTETRHGLPVLAFATPEDLHRWLGAQPGDAPGMWLRLRKKGSPVASVTKAEAIDGALCHGWIDGQVDKYDDDSWLVRMTPRRQQSKWSQVNRTRALELIAAGLMLPAGRAEIDKAKADGRWEMAYAPASTIEIPPDLEEALAASPQAAAFFSTLKGANRYAILYRIGAVKKADTRERKIAQFVAMLERGETIHG